MSNTQTANNDAGNTAFFHDADFGTMTSPISTSSPYSTNSFTAAAPLTASSSSFVTSLSSSSMSPPPSISSPTTATAVAAAAMTKHKPHKCDVCGACFARKVHLQRHSLRHQVCKPYCCERCGKCFSRQDSLVRHHRLLHEGSISGAAPIKAASASKAASLMAGIATTSDGKKVTKKASAGKRASLPILSTARTLMQEQSPACVRCSSIAVPCDGQQPCSRCNANHGGQACVYALGVAKKRSRQRKDSFATVSSSSSMHAADDNDETMTADDGSSLAWSLHGVRRHTADSVASSTTTMSEPSLMSPAPSSSTSFVIDAASAWSSMPLSAGPMDAHSMSSASVLHPFDLPQLGSSFGAHHDDVAHHTDAGFVDVKTLHPDQMHYNATGHFDASAPQPLSNVLPYQHGHEAQQTAPFSSHTMTMPFFDWTSLMHSHPEQQQQQQQQQQQLQQQQRQHAAQRATADFASHDTTKQPFSGAASNKALNATLLSGPEHMLADSSFPSPSPFGLQLQHQHALHHGAPQQLSRQGSSSSIAAGDTSTLPAHHIAAQQQHTPSNLTINLPANFASMSADSWEGFMRQLSVYNGGAATATGVAA